MMAIIGGIITAILILVVVAVGVFSVLLVGQMDRQQDRVLPCGCVLCICESEGQCFGCGAKMCEMHKAESYLKHG